MRSRKISKNKKALSEIISYALLILIAFVIGTGVFIWISKLIDKPPEDGVCPDGVSIVIRNVECNFAGGIPADTINVTIANQGRFNIAGFVVKGSNNPNVKAAVNIYPNDAPYKLVNLDNLNLLPNESSPGQEDSYKFSYGPLAALSKISIVAIRNQSEKMVVCTNSLVGQDVSCS